MTGRQLQQYLQAVARKYGRATATRVYRSLMARQHAQVHPRTLSHAQHAANARRALATPPVPVLTRLPSGRSGPGGPPPSGGASGPLVNLNAGDAVAADIASLLDKEARGVLGDIPGGTAALNAVESVVGDVLKPQFSGGVTADQGNAITQLAARNPVAAAQLAADIEGAVGTKQIYDPTSPTGYRVVGGARRGGPGFSRGDD